VNTRIENRNILVVGQQAWDTAIGSNCKDIALEFSKHNRVLYINAPLDRRTKIQQAQTDAVKRRLASIRGQQSGLEKINDSLYVFYPDVMIESINFIKWTKVLTWVNRYNNKQLAKSIQKALDALHFTDFILFNDGDMFRSFHLKELLRPSVNVYYSRDNLMATDYWGKHGKYFEPKLIAKSDVCVANSVYLTNYCKQYNPQSYYVGQGCDLRLFKNDDSVVVPDELKRIKKPILGYVGALLAARLAIDILIHLAKQRPHWSIVLVGPEDELFQQSELHQLDNVYFTGAKRPHELPAYIKGFDVCLNPQVLNPLTIGNYPRKLDEYLAMGKPTIATKTEGISIFKNYVYMAETKEEYLDLAEKALAENDSILRKKRIDFAHTHTWENSVAEIYRAIKQVHT
jgi:glycosyltransferase involved in cell wall biosynthesis